MRYIKLLKDIESKTDQLEFVYKTIEYAKSKYNKIRSLDSPQIGNLISILYSISDFAKFNFKKSISSNFTNGLNLSNCNLSRTQLPGAFLIRVDFH